MATSWVATITVLPVRLIRYSSCMIPIEVSGSRLPVGSSASSSGGGVANGGAPGGARRRGGVDERGGHGDALLLAARQLVGVVVQLQREAGEPQHVRDLLADL